MITRSDKKRLIQLLGMIGSNHDGEMYNAAKLVRQFITHHKLSFYDLFEARDGIGLRNGSASTLKGLNLAAGGGWGEGEGYQEGYEQGLEKGAELASEAIRESYHKGFHEGVKSWKAANRNRAWKTWAKDRLDNDADCLTDWEVKFFHDFWTGRFAVPTANQRKIFVKVAERLGIEPPGENPSADELPF